VLEALRRVLEAVVEEWRVLEVPVSLQVLKVGGQVLLKITSVEQP